MKFVILTNKIIPGFTVKGPILTPTEYDIYQVLRWVAAGVDIREVMEDGSYRKLSFNDERLVAELAKMSMKHKADLEKAKNELMGAEIKPNGIVQLKPEKSKKNKKINKPAPMKKEEVIQKKEEPKQEEINDMELFIDQLEKPE